MSHEDPDGRTAFPYNFQALKDAFLWLLQAADLSPIQFRGDCTWSTLVLIFTALLWSWSDEKTLQDRFSTARRFASRLWESWPGQGADDEPAGSYQAFMKMLRIWTASLVLQLMVAFGECCVPCSLIGSPSPASKSSPSMAVGSKCRGRSPTSRGFLLGRLRSGGVARARNGVSPPCVATGRSAPVLRRPTAPRYG